MEADAPARAARRARRADGRRARSANLRATLRPKARTAADVARAAATWADAERLVLGGDFNLRRVDIAGLEHVAGHGVDHVLAPAGEARRPRCSTPAGSPTTGPFASCSAPCEPVRSTSRASRSVHVSRRTTSRAAPSRRRRRDPKGAVVVVRHREAVRAGRRARRAGRPTRGSGARSRRSSASPLSQWRPDHRHRLAAVRADAVEDRRLEALAEQRHLEVVAHPTVDGDERARAALDGRTRKRRRCWRDHAAPAR